MRLLSQDGDTFDAPDAAGIVAAMAAASRSRPANLAVFMAETAMRVRSMSGASIRSATAEDFVADLLMHGFLKPAPDTAGNGLAGNPGE